jgi:hypothetical protein
MSSSKSTERTPLPDLIAWLSLCILAAAWGPALDPFWRTMWFNLGLFGVVAGIGLTMVAQSRAAQRLARQRQRWQEQLEQRLNQLLHDDELSEPVRAAITDIVADLRQRGRTPRAEHSPAWPTFDRPVRFTPLGSCNRDDLIRASSYPAFLQHLSAGRVSLVHCDPVSDQHIVMLYDLLDGRVVPLLVELTWRNTIEGGWIHSGGRVLAVAAPDEPDTEAMPQPRDSKMAQPPDRALVGTGVAG